MLGVLGGRLAGMTYKLVLLRHGQSAWNKTNQFTGWVDVPLTEQGVEEAKNGGRLLKEKNVLPDIVFTSMLRRAINTANVALDEADRLWIPVKRSWRLNERHYGALQGKNKTEIRQEYGDEKFMLWRRSYATAVRAGRELQADQAAWRVSGSGSRRCWCRRCRRPGPEVSLLRLIRR